MSDRAGGPGLFSIRGLRAGYDGTPALTVDELHIAAGEVTVLVGENGSGKTTLLRLLNGLLEPWAGRIEFRGLPLDGPGRAALRSESVLVHQAPLLFRGSVLQNVGYGLRIQGVDRKVIAKRCGRTLESVGLAGFSRRRSAGLSGGEKQRVALARALVLGRPVVLLDEPTANLDPDSRAVLERAIRGLAAEGTSVIMSTHLMDTAYRLCDTLVRLEAGRIVGDAENILRGRVEGTDEQFTRFAAAGADGRAAATLLCPARQGDFRVAVLRMDEIILSRHALESSARNRLRGRVTAIQTAGSVLVVSVDCGVVLKTLITPAAAEELGLAPGQEVVATFKASAIGLY